MSMRTFKIELERSDGQRAFTLIVAWNEEHAFAMTKVLFRDEQTLSVKEVD